MNISDNYSSTLRVVIAVIALCILGFSSVAEAKVKLPVLVSDGMVLQREAPVKIWGWADANENIEITFLKKTYKTAADPEGNWSLILPAPKAGGPHTMKINDIELKDILIGDVFLCSGQSNMETPIQRTMDLFAEEVLSYENENIRYIKLSHDYSFQGEKDDVKPTVWRPVTQEYVQSMAAVPYFFARFLYEEKKIPIGLINTAVGGSPAEAWISEEYLADFPHYLHDMEICRTEGYIESVNQLQNQRNRLYTQAMNEGDPGLRENWKSSSYNDNHWNTIDLFSDWGSDGVNPVNGSHWFRKNIHIPVHLVEKKAVLRLGCIVDADSVFVNGIFIGNTTYQYPPRVYPIPENLLKEGENNITIRLFGNNGRPHFVKDKPYKIVFDEEEISLSGEWKYRLGCRMLPLPDGVNFQNKATVLYNAMMAPLKNLTFKGVLWYQGESNTNRYNEYYALMENLIRNWRELFGKPELPFIIAQLPNFMPAYDYPTESEWAELRNVQLKLSQTIPNVGLTVNIDLGEWNDIHPLNKKDVGYRLMLQAEKLIYGNSKIIADGPIYESFEISGNKIILTFNKETDLKACHCGLATCHCGLDPQSPLNGFSIAGKDGKFHWAKAKIENGKIIVWNDAISEPKRVRYAWADNPAKANLYNEAGLPASPFQTESAHYEISTWPDFRKAAARNGHEIGSHIMTHPNLATIPVEQQEKELKESRNLTNEMLTSRNACVTLAYPYCGIGDMDLVKKYFIAARVCSGHIVPPTPEDYYTISSINCGTEGLNDMESFREQLAEAREMNGWCVCLMHGIDGDGYSSVTSEFLEESLEYLDRNREAFWVATFRDAVQVSEIKNEKDRIEILVTDNLDNDIYNLPLTIRRALPQSWENAEVIHENKTINFTIQSENNIKYLVFDAIPDTGTITIKQLNN